MNPRIQELARQALLEHCVSHVRLQEFADLIIQECLDQCRKEWYTLNNTNTQETDPRLLGIQIGQKSGVLKCINKIAELKNDV